SLSPLQADDEVLNEVVSYIEWLLSAVRPQKLLYLAIDGVAPRAKMNQQRSRRFLTAQESNGNTWDTNCITPGTEFMTKLADRLRCWIARNLTSNKSWEKAIILSDASVPGEGEHKIMNFIKAQTTPAKDFIYSVDGDLILLSLMQNEKHIDILRPNQGKGLIILSANTLQQRLAKTPPFFRSKDAINDWVFLWCLVKNDYLPRLPTFEMAEVSFDKLIAIWWKICGDECLTSNGTLNLTQFESLMKELTKEEGKRTMQEAVGAQNYDGLRLGEPGFKECYYEKHFGEKWTLEFSRKVVQAYVQGLCWLLEYDHRGVCSWRWFYPFHYAPLASDFVNLVEISKFDIDKPFKPFEHLMGVMPITSKNLLPQPLANLMVDENSSIAEFYPENVQVDRKVPPIKDVVLLPFVKEANLINEVNNVNSKLNDAEIARNNEGNNIVCFSTKHSLYDNLLDRFPAEYK
ncbi:4329_t:CDS:10, partial [Paraglomus occultum]